MSGEEKDSSDPQDQPTMDFLRPAAPAAITARYEILGEAGRGGMGIVYKARDRETGELVALKVLKPEIAADQAAMERFKNELRLARKITHRNVCRTHDFYRAADGTAYISMEFVDGDSLRAIVARFGGLGFRKAMEIAVQVCAALGEAHRQGVVHRDLKPENIMLARDGVIKVMDFGVARCVEAAATLTGHITGTPAYMAPEQAAGKPDVDHRADIYSLGLILYEIYTGAPAVRGDTPVAVVMKQIHDTPTSPREVEPALPGHIEKAILKCLEKNPAKRFQSVDELQAALTQQPQVRTAAEVEGAETPLPLHLTRWQRSDWLLLSLAVVGLSVFFPFFDRTSLAPRSKVSFDRSVLRRIAQDYARRLGAPVEGEGRIETEAFRQGYDYVAERAGARAALELTNNPVPYWVWYVAWENGTRVFVDNRGFLDAFQRDFPGGAPSERLSLEEARPLAEKALREYFGREASEMVLETAASDTWKGYPAASFTWVDRNDYYGIKRRYVVRLVGREIAHLNRVYYLPAEYVARDLIPGWQLLPIMALELILLVLGFSQRHLVDLRARWRVAMAALIFVCVTWYAWQIVLADFVGVLKILLCVMMGLGWALVVFIGLIAVERSVRRMAPAALVSFTRLFERGAASEPCGLAILRGTCVGLALLGTETFLVWLGTDQSRMWLNSFYHIVFQVYGLLRSPWSSAHALSAVLQAAAIAFHTAFLVSFVMRLVRHSWPALLMAAMLSALTFSAPSITLGAVQPYHWKALLVWFDFLVLAWTFTRFDVLTLAWAAFTFAFCWQNYGLLVMLAPAGVLEPWIAFAIWGLLVLGAAVVAFQASLRAARRRIAAAFE